MPAQVLVIGLDAAEATLIERWAAEGRMPAFAALAARAEPIRLGNSLETLPGAVWPEIVNGISGGRQARFYHSRKLHTGEAGFRRIEADEVNPAESYWAIAAAHGRRIAVFNPVRPRAGSERLPAHGMGRARPKLRDAERTPAATRRD
jgi:hypothetical protein